MSAWVAAGAPVSTFHVLNKGGLISEIHAWQDRTSKALTAIQIRYTDGQYNVLGDPKKIALKTAAAGYAGNVTIGFGNQIQDIVVWVNPATRAVYGLYIATISSSQPALFAKPPAGITSANAALAMSGGALGSGYLFGLAGTTESLPTIGTAITSVDFIFMASPLAVSVTYDMPSINIDNLVVQLKSVTKAAISNSGSATVSSTCPDFSTKVPYVISYGRNKMGMDLRQLLSSTSVYAREYMRPTSLQWTGNATGLVGTVAVTYQASVANPFSTEVTDDAGFAATLSAPTTSFQVAGGKCM